MQSMRPHAVRGGVDRVTVAFERFGSCTHSSVRVAVRGGRISAAVVATASADPLRLRSPGARLGWYPSAVMTQKTPRTRSVHRTRWRCLVPVRRPSVVGAPAVLTLRGTPLGCRGKILRTSLKLVKRHRHRASRRLSRGEVARASATTKRAIDTACSIGEVTRTDN